VSEGIDVTRRITNRCSALLLVLFLLPAEVASPETTSQSLPPIWPDAAEIETFLKEAKITERVEIGEGVTKPDKVTLEMDGRVLYGIAKTVDKNHDNWRHEVAAYELDKLLGLGMVPPTVERGSWWRGKGCIQLWVDAVRMDNFEGEPTDPAAWRRQVSLMWLFDDLIGNVDRHLRNAMINPEHRLILIDNSKSCYIKRTLVNDLNGRGTGTHARFWGVPFEESRVSYPTTYPADFIARLRALTDDQIERAVGRYIKGNSRDLILERRRLIFERLDEMGDEVLSER
jgi:hypothetical protein